MIIKKFTIISSYYKLDYNINWKFRCDMTDLYRLLPEEMEKLVTDMGYDRYRADQILMPLYYKFPKNIADIKQLPKTMIVELIENGYTIGSAKEIHKITSDDGDTTKVLLNLTNNKSVETVLMQY